MRLTLMVLMQNDGDFVDIILLYLHPVCILYLGDCEIPFLYPGSCYANYLLFSLSDYYLLRVMYLSYSDWERRGQSGIWIPAGAKDFLSSRIVNLGCGTRPLSYSMRTGFVSRMKSGRMVKLTTRVHLVPRLRISGSVSLFLPFYRHGADRGKSTFLFTYVVC